MEKNPAGPIPLLGAGFGWLGGVRQKSAPVTVRCTTPVAASLALRQAPPDTVIHRRLHCVRQALTPNGALAAHRLCKLVLECAGREKQIRVVLRTQCMCPPVLIGVQ
jgi:hypothetical protein